MIAWYPAERHSDDAAGFFNGSRVGNTSYVPGAVGEAFVFDGSGDRVDNDVAASEQRAVRTFSYELWARPTAANANCPQSNVGTCGVGQRWAIFPVFGDNPAPADEAGLAAGVGIAIGTNGVCVGEHASFLVDCLARLDTPITAWTHVVAVVENKTPRIYINGVLRHTGIASAKQFVFASWAIVGSGLALGEYAGELDEITVYGRALSDAEIAALFAAGTMGKCRTCVTQRSDDAWNGAEVTANTGLLSSNPNGMFGGSTGSPEPTNTLFADGQADGTAHSIQWRTSEPITLPGIALAASHNAPDVTARAFRRFVLESRETSGNAFATIYAADIVTPYGPGSADLARCINLRPRTAQEFRATFTQHGPPGTSGPRVLELDAIVLPNLVFRDGFEDAP